MPSIIIPAHNEESVIAETLAALMSGLDSDVEVIVVCNGCDDRTADIARDMDDRVQVVVIEPASKVAALNTGDMTASGFPRIYMDADVHLDGASAVKIIQHLRTADALAAEPEPEIDTSRSSLLVKAYYTVSLALHGRQPGDVGGGVYAMSALGRSRFSAFPDVIGDDAFARAQFGPGELTRVDGAHSVVYAPERASDLIRIKSRSRLGNLELNREYSQLWAKKRASTPSLREKAAALPIRVWPMVPAYVAMQLIARIRAKRLHARAGAIHWQRDESSRRRTV